MTNGKGLMGVLITELNLDSQTEFQMDNMKDVVESDSLGKRTG